MRNIQREINNQQYSDNIPRPRKNANFYRDDKNIQYLMRRYLPAHIQEWADIELLSFGAKVANDIDERAFYTDKEGKPRLQKYNRLGEDISHIVTNDGYKQTVKETYESGIVSYVFRDVPELGEKVPFLYSFLQGYLLSQSEPGFHCPVTLSLSAAFLIDRYGNDEQKEIYLNGLTALDYDYLYEGATWLTERQGGSDVGANLTEAVPDEHNPGTYKLTGEKFFASNAGAMVATVLARVHTDQQGTKGLGLFLVPWIKPNGEKNQVYIRRLKDKLGVNAVPSAEVILEEAEGTLIGEPDQGFKYMAQALNISRISNAISSIAIMRRAFTESYHYTTHRQAFGRTIADNAPVKATLVHMAVELEANTDACFAMAAAFDKVHTTEDATREETILARMLIPLLKHRTGEAVKTATHQAIEAHGGNGYIEEYVTPRLLRDAQVLSVWEGPSNILALDLLRVMKKDNSHDVFFQTILQTLRQVKHPLAQPMITVIKETIQELKEAIQHLFTQHEDIIMYHMKTFADALVDVYELTVLLQEAEEQVRDNGNARKFVIARLFKTYHFDDPTHRGLLATDLDDLTFYQAIVDHEDIPEEHVVRHTSS